MRKFLTLIHPYNHLQLELLSECNGIRAHNHLDGKRIGNHLTKLVKLLSFVVSTCLHGAFDCMF